MDLLIKSAKIIAPNDALHKQEKDILIQQGVIKKISNSIDNTFGIRELTFPNLHISLGWMDSSVSFGEPGLEERETLENGLKVAANSGFTAIAVNPNSSPMIDNASAVHFLISKTEKNPVDLFPIGCFTKEANGIDMAELYDMKQKGAIAFYDPKKPIQNANLLKMGLLYTQSFDGILMSFPEEVSTSYGNKANESAFTLSLGFEGSPSLSEELQIVRDLLLLEYTEGKLFIPTISTEKSLKLIKDAHKNGLNITCSVSAHHLFLTDKELANFDTNFKINPPLRSEKDIKALQKGVKDGTISIVTSDHQPMDIDNKRKEFSYAKHGTIGMESFFGALNSVMNLEDFIEGITTRPRQIFNLSVPSFKEGSKANFTLFDPEPNWIFNEKDIISTSKNSAFIGKKMKGLVYGIINNNQLIVNKINLK